MALIKCPECNKDISKKAKQCPNCGYDLNISKKRNSIKFVFLVIGLFIAITLIVVIIDACTTSTDELADDLKRSKQELQDIQDQIDDLERQKRYNDWLIEQYENGK